MTEDTPRPRLLVIDDEFQVGQMLQRLLRRDYDVTAVTSAAEALPLAREGTFDAILCDVRMPGMTGPEFYVALSGEHPEVARRVGFMTGGTFESDVRALIAAQGDRGWLAKPFTREALHEFLARLVDGD